MCCCRKKQPTPEIQDRNGVRVRVFRDKNGSTVEADCKCLGQRTYVHSNINCPVYKRHRK